MQNRNYLPTINEILLEISKRASNFLMHALQLLEVMFPTT